MKKLFVALVLVAGLAGAVPAQVKTVPAEVLTWYADTMAVFGDLLKGIEKAQDAKAASSAFQSATKAIAAKNLQARFQKFKAQYPAFFEGDEAETGAWVPPPEWLKVVEDYGRTMETYAGAMQKTMAWYGDPGLQKALEEFSDAMDMDQ